MVINDFWERESAKKGRKGEDQSENWLGTSHKCVTIPLSKIKEFSDKGPRIHYPDPMHPYLISPDLQVMRTALTPKDSPLPLISLLEIKTKGRCSWYRINQAWQSGIDRYFWRNYLRTNERLPIPVWVAHLIEPTSERSMDLQGVPEEKRPAPSGLYVHPITLPIAYDPNRSSALVYWKIEDMCRLASWEEVTV